MNSKAQTIAPPVTWIKQANAPGGYVEPKASVTDKFGNTYVTGFYVGQMEIGSNFFPQVGIDNITFLAKYDKDGNVLWVKRSHTYRRNRPGGVAVDSQGNIFLIGTFNDSISFGAPVTQGQYETMFIVSFTGAGVHRWTQTGTGTGLSHGGTIAADSMGNCYFSGGFETDFAIGGVQAPSSTVQQIVYGKINSAGQVEWLLSGKNFYTSGIVADQTGGCILSGGTNQYVALPAEIDGVSVPAGKYLVTLTDSGTVGSIKPALMPGPITRNESGNLFVVSSISGILTLDSVTVWSTGFNNVLLSVYDPNGDVIWAETFGGGSEAGNQIALDESGNIFLAGTFFEHPAEFGNVTFPVKGQSDVFVLKLNSNGELLWAKSFGSIHTDVSCGLGTDAAGNCYFYGSYKNALYFEDDSILTGSNNYFLTKIGDLVSGANLDNIQSGIQLYPNPTSGNFTLDLSGSEIKANGNVEVYNLIGQKVLSKPIGGPLVKFSLMGLPKGPYLVRVQTENQVLKRRLILE